MQGMKDFFARFAARWRRVPWKKIGVRLLFIPTWLIFLLSIASAAGTVFVFARGWEESLLAIPMYVLAFYALCTLTVLCIKVFPKLYHRAKAGLGETHYGNLYLNDIGYKVRVSLYLSLGINLAYSALKLLTGILYASVWDGAEAIYYVILSVIRFLLLKYMRASGDRSDLISEYRRYRLCAILQIPLILTLSGFVLHMLWQNEAYAKHEITVIATAAYTFYTVTLSIVDMVRYRKYKSPVISASKAIRFAAALVSLLSLETSMLVRFGESNSEQFRTLMIALTGAGVCLTVLGMSGYMIVKSTAAIRTLRAPNPPEA